MELVVESWIKNELGTIEELGEAINRSPKTLKTDYVSSLRKQGRLPQARQGKRSGTSKNKCRISGTSVENLPPPRSSEPPEEVIDVVVSSPPAADLTPDPPIETTENRMFEPEPLTPTGESSDDVKTLIKRERQSMAERVSRVRHLQDFNQAATKHWEHLQRKYKSQGRSVIAHNMRIAARSLQEDKALEQWAESLGIPADSSYEDCLWATVDLARNLDKSIRLSLYLAGFIDGPGQMDRPTGT